MNTPETICHWANRKALHLVSAGFTMVMGKIDGIKEELGADRKQDKMSTIIDGLQKSVNPTLVQQLSGKKIVVSTCRPSLSTMLTGLPADDLLNKYQLPQPLKDMVDNYKPPKQQQTTSTISAFANAFKINLVNSPDKTPPQQQKGYTQEQEDVYIALAAKEIFRQIAGHLEPVMEKQGEKEEDVVWTFKVVNKPKFQEVAASLFRGGEISSNDGSMFITYGILKTINAQ